LRQGRHHTAKPAAVHYLRDRSVALQQRPAVVVGRGQHGPLQVLAAQRVQEGDIRLVVVGLLEPGNITADKVRQNGIASNTAATHGMAVSTQLSPTHSQTTAWTAPGACQQPAVIMTFDKQDSCQKGKPPFANVQSQRAPHSRDKQS